MPVVLWIHGGGWVLFTGDTYDASCRGVANKTGVMHEFFGGAAVLDKAAQAQTQAAEHFRRGFAAATALVP